MQLCALQYHKREETMEDSQFHPRSQWNLDAQSRSFRLMGAVVMRLAEMTEEPAQTTDTGMTLRQSLLH